MAKYTIELREIARVVGYDEVEKWFSSYELSDYLTENEINTITTRGTWSKDKLAKKIVRHYLTSEIGSDTPTLFAYRVGITMEELMEEYLPLIYSASIQYDPLVNVDFTESYSHNSQGNGETSTQNDNTTTNSGSGLTINSDTPQGEISKSNILNGTYATSTSGSETSTSISDSGNGTTNTSSTSQDSYIKSIRGNSGISATAQKMIQQYRDNIRAIDREIIDKLNPLFIGVF